MDFPDTNFFLIKVEQKVLNDFKLILTVLKLSFKVIEFKSIGLLFFLFDLFCFGSFFRLYFLLFLFDLLGLLGYNLSFHLWFLIDFEFDFKGLFSTKDNFTKIFTENRNGSNIIIPSEQIDKFLSLTLCDNQSILVNKIYLNKFSR